MECKKCKKEMPEGALFCPWCGHDQQPHKKRRGNGQGTILREVNGTYTAVATSYANYKRETRKKRGFVRKREAAEWLATVNFAMPSAPPVTFKELYEEWSPLYFASVSEKRANIIRGIYARCSRLYNMRWVDIGVRHMQQLINDQPETYYPRRDMKALFSLMGQYAIVSGYADRDFSSALKLPPKTPPHKEPFSPEEVDLLWRDYALTGDPYTGAALVMIYTGMRCGELTKATPELVHLADGYMMGGKKTEAGRAGEIILVPAIRPIVERLVVRGELPKVSDTAFRKHYDAALERAGTRPHTIHECRHTTATELARAGVQPAIIAAIMRHSSYAQTLDYTHIDRQTKLEAITTKLHPEEN